MPQIQTSSFPDTNLYINSKRELSSSKFGIFADRDGTLIKHVDYIADPDAIELLPGVKEAVHQIIESQVHFFILTNQSGVGRGYFPIERVYACQRRLFELLELKPEEISGWCIAPELPGTDGRYRKPSTRFLQEASKQLDFDLKHSHVIGDTLVDLQTAWNAHAHAWALGCGKPELPEAHRSGAISGEYTFVEDFPAAVRQILSN